VEHIDTEDVDRDSLRRALRDLEAAEARVQRNAERVYDDVRAKLIEELLPLADDLDRTLESASHRDPALVQAVRMMRAHLEKLLERYGVERLDAVGLPFDPTIHDAISTVPVESRSADRIVVDQLQPGYRFAGRLLRPAKVVVGVLN
jgi:molecular chaperone GrpE